MNLLSKDLKSSKKNSPGRAPKKATPKKPDETAELAQKEFNPEFCKARKWNKGDAGELSPDEAGHGMQCWFLAVDGGFCEKCAERFGDDTKENWGLFCEPLRESQGQKANGKPHPWKALKNEEKEKSKKEKAEKKAKEKEEKLRKEELARQQAEESSSVTLTVIWVSILHQIWLGLYWILRCEMNIFWAGGVCQELQRRLSPRAKGQTCMWPL